MLPGPARRLRVRLRPLHCLATAWFAVASAGCAPQPISPYAQRSGSFYEVPFNSTGAVTVRTLPQAHNGFAWFPHLSWRNWTAQKKLHPRLAQWLATLPPSTPVVLLVGLRDTVRVQRLPIESMEGSITGMTPLLADSVAESLVSDLFARRANGYVEQLKELRKLSTSVTDSFLITQAAIVHTTLDKVLFIAQEPFVRSVQPANSGDPPPCTPAAIGAVESNLHMDVFRNEGLAFGRIRLLDTGVKNSHPWFGGLGTDPIGAATTPALVTYDALSSDCPVSDVGDIDNFGGHGTSTASILVSTAAGPNRGLTNARLDAFRVYFSDTTIVAGTPPRVVIKTALSDTSVVAALQGRSELVSPIIAVETESETGPEAPITRAAENAFLWGSAVIAAAGNLGLQDTTPAPGNGRWVLAVGARSFDALGQEAYPDQSHGTFEKRHKPDIQMPTCTIAAGNTPQDFTHDFRATSGAVPYAAAAALEMRNWLLRANRPVDPGQVYSALIACGETKRDTKFPIKRGAGLVRMPRGGRGWFGSVELLSHGSIDIPIRIDDASAAHIVAGLWWPDGGSVMLPFGIELGTHRDFDLEVRRADGSTTAKSVGSDGVFERVQLSPGSRTQGDWIVRITSGGVGASKATVYWTMFATP